MHIHTIRIKLKMHLSLTHANDDGLVLTAGADWLFKPTLAK